MDSWYTCIYKYSICRIERETFVQTIVSERFTLVFWLLVITSAHHEVLVRENNKKLKLDTSWSVSWLTQTSAHNRVQVRWGGKIVMTCVFGVKSLVSLSSESRPPCKNCRTSHRLLSEPVQFKRQSCASGPPVRARWLGTSRCQSDLKFIEKLTVVLITRLQLLLPTEPKQVVVSPQSQQTASFWSLEIKKKKNSWVYRILVLSVLW